MSAAPSGNQRLCTEGIPLFGLHAQGRRLGLRASSVHIILGFTDSLGFGPSVWVLFGLLDLEFELKDEGFGPVVVAFCLSFRVDDQGLGFGVCPLWVSLSGLGVQASGFRNWV